MSYLDYPLIDGIFIILSLTVFASNYIVDIIYVLVDSGVDPMAYTISMVNSAIGGANPDAISRNWASSFQGQLNGQRQMWSQASMQIGMISKPFSE